MLVPSKFGWSQTLRSNVVKWVHCHKLTIACCLICLPRIHFEHTHIYHDHCWLLLLE